MKVQLIGTKSSKLAHPLHQLIDKIYTLITIIFLTKSSTVDCEIHISPPELKELHQ